MILAGTIPPSRSRQLFQHTLLYVDIFSTTLLFHSDSTTSRSLNPRADEPSRNSQDIPTLSSGFAVRPSNRLRRSLAHLVQGFRYPLVKAAVLCPQNIEHQMRPTFDWILSRSGVASSFTTRSTPFDLQVMDHLLSLARGDVWSYLDL